MRGRYQRRSDKQRSAEAFAVGNVVQHCNSSLQVPIPSASPMRFSLSQDMGNHDSKGISNYRLGDVQDSGSSSNVPDRKSPVFMRVGRIACIRRSDRSGPQRTYYPRPGGAILPHRKLARAAIPYGFAGRRRARWDRAPGNAFSACERRTLGVAEAPV
jgi:hypothetical protein